MTEQEQTTDTVPLVVDLDGTLIRADLLCEGLFRLARHRPFRLPGLLPALFRGRAAFKAAVAERGAIDPETLPWNDAVIEYLGAERARGRAIWLATAADRVMAQAVADHLGLFDRVLASEGGHNLKGRHKLAALQAAAPDGFDYIGDAAADLPLFRAARHGWTVGPWARTLAARARHDGADAAPLPGVPQPPALPRALLRLIRPHQWLKNLLVFLPLIAAHQWTEAGVVSYSLLTFVAFCLVASAAYVFNDLLDIEHDRRHPRKRHRPIASGAVPQPLALVLFPSLLVMAAVVALALPAAATAVLAGYFVLTTAYSVFLKRLAMIDILSLTALYNLRILGGGAATGIVLSHWLVGFTLFLFFGLGVMKRVTEVQELSRTGGEVAAGRGYRAGDEWMLIPLGVSASVAATLVLGLYTSSDAFVELYSRPVPLLLVVPLILFWLSTLWLHTIRGRMHDDPLVFAVRDRVTWAVAVAVGVLFIAAL